MLGEKVEDARDEDVQVARIVFPALVAVGLHVRPLVVQVE